MNVPAGSVRNLAVDYTVDATDVENPTLVCIDEANENSYDEVDDSFTESRFSDSITVATAESDETETTNKSALVCRARKSFARRTSFARMKSISSLRPQKRGSSSGVSSSGSVISSSEDTGEDVFLLKDNKKKSEVQAADKWWKFVFVFSLISMTACILTLWLKYPYGARMSTEEVATMPWSNGCIGLDSCICPRVSPACEIRFRRTL